MPANTVTAPQTPSVAGHCLKCRARGNGGAGTHYSTPHSPVLFIGPCLAGRWQKHQPQPVPFCGYDARPHCYNIRGCLKLLNIHSQQDWHTDAVEHIQSRVLYTQPRLRTASSVEGGGSGTLRQEASVAHTGMQRAVRHAPLWPSKYLVDPVCALMLLWLQAQRPLVQTWRAAAGVHLWL